MADLRALPTLDELAARPERAAELPAEAAEALLGRCIAVQSVIYGRLLAARCNGKAVREADGDRLVSIGEVAARIGKSRSWVEKHGDDLPPRRRVGGEGLWSERELEAWIRTRPRWGDG